MTIYEQRLCEKQGELFEKSSDLPCSSALFIRRYMDGSTARDQDLAAMYFDASKESASSLFESLVERYPDLTKRQGLHYPSCVLHWMGYIYRAWAVLAHKSSSTIYESMKAEDLLPLYDSFHTFDPKYCVKRLQEIVEEKEGPALSDYEVYKTIKLGY
jgi:hypothetical protein